MITKVVDVIQSRFDANRKILNHMLLGSELIKGRRRKYKSLRYMLKIAKQKAYDLMEWAFNEQKM